MTRLNHETIKHKSTLGISYITKHTIFIPYTIADELDIEHHETLYLKTKPDKLIITRKHTDTETKTRRKLTKTLHGKQYYSTKLTIPKIIIDTLNWHDIKDVTVYTERNEIIIIPENH